MRVAGVEAGCRLAVAVVAADGLERMDRQIEHGFAHAIQRGQRNGRGQLVAVGRVVELAVGKHGRHFNGAQHAVGQCRGIETRRAQAPGIGMQRAGHLGQAVFVIRILPLEMLRAEEQALTPEDFG
ncbi:hypothetical protein D3C71_1377630 [compost metagenome]